MPFNPILEDPTLELPIGGKTYTVESPDAPTGMWVQRMMDNATTGPVELDDDDERNFYQRILGPTYDELLADDVPWHALKRVAATAAFWIVYGDEVAERYWNRDQDEPAEAPAEQV